MPDDPMMVYAAETILKQTVICLLSETIKNLHGGDQIELHPWKEKGDVVVTFTIAPQTGDFAGLREQLAHDDMIWSLVQAVGAELAFVPLAGQNLHIELRLPQHRCTLLVIDDNPDVIRLIERYVTQSQYAVVGVLDAMEGLDLARRIQPFAIILDVMMPEYDGWEIMQHLKNHPETRHIPVLICSVLDTPELAFSLGADFFIKKPPGRVDLLKMLAQMAE
jgi:CheY-like chemotaxis protein